MNKKFLIQRPSLYVLLTVLAVMIVMGAVCSWVCYQAVKTERQVRYMGMMKVTSEKIGKTIRGMEMNAKNVFDEVDKNLDTPESVIAALESKTSLNPDVRGYFAAFEPEYFPEKGKWFEPYVHQCGSSKFEVNQVGSARHDYTKSEWYLHAKDRVESLEPDSSENADVSVGFWSEPYYYQDNDEIGISGYYCTFVKPILNAENRLACVCGADMTLEWLVDELQKIDTEGMNKGWGIEDVSPFGETLDFYSVIINKDGTCIAHPNGKRVTMVDEPIVSDLEQKKSGVVDMNVNGVSSMVYYGPIDYIDWSVAVIVPKQIILKPILMVSLFFLLAALLGVVAVWWMVKRGWLMANGG